MADYVVANPGRGSRGEREHRDSVPAVAEGFKVAIVGAEVVAPLRYAVGLVNRQQADIQRTHELGEPRSRQPFGRNVEHLQCSSDCQRPHATSLRVSQRTVQKLRRNAICLQTVHLVFHERDQRRDHDGHTVKGERGKLVAE